jgi:dienelactone hydrolase
MKHKADFVVEMNTADASALRSELARFLGLSAPPSSVSFETQEQTRRDGYDELRIDFAADGDEQVPAYLLVPNTDAVLAGVLVQHQHAGEWHWGKSEVAGHVGNPLQAFGPALARRGLVVLAPDAIGFEDRRAHQKGTGPADGDTDWLHHYNAMAHRLVHGDTLMRRVLTDAMAALSLLMQLPQTRGRGVGSLGHSYGGNTVLFHAAVDERIQFACASGAACSYRHKLASATGIEMAEVIPGFASRWDIEDLIRAMAPRSLLLVSGERDPYSADADEIEQMARHAYEQLGRGDSLVHRRDNGPHAMTPARFEYIVNWICDQATSLPR